MAKILIADDSTFIRTDLKRALETAGHEVFEAEDGALGVSLFQQKESEIQLIICDINMPNLDGVSMSKQISALCADKARAVPPIFALTTETSPELKTEGKKAGIIAWIPKPFDPAKLLHAITTILAKQKA